MTSPAGPGGSGLGGSGTAESAPFGRSGLARRPWLAGLLSGLATLGVLALLVGLTGLWVYKAPGPKARSGASTTVILPHGARVAEIAADLQRAGVVRSAPIFMALSQLTGAARRLKAGEYAFASRLPLARVIAQLRSGAVVHHKITIPEGLTSRQAVDVLMRTDVLTGPAVAPAEGAVLPETYEVVRGESRATLIKRMADDDNRLLATLWDKRQPGLPFTNVEQAVVLASIVEKETALASERPLIAGVYLNRIRQGVKLEADPTVIYGLNGGAPLGHGLRESELKSDTPYNTYLNPGLPPTPIDNPGRASLAAVLDPHPTDDLYFVANGTGGHVFAKTLAEHQHNVLRWRAIERGRAKAAPALVTAALAGAPVQRPLEHR